MLRDMFSDIRQPSIAVGSKKRYTVAVSVIVHTAIIAAVMIIPLVATDVLPTPPIMTVFLSNPVPPPPPPPPPPVEKVLTPRDEQSASLAPVQPPSGITPETVQEHASAEPLNSMGGVLGGVADGILGGRAEVLPPPPAPAPSRQEPVHIGGKIKTPTRVRDVMPIYPPIAQMTHVQGVVIIEATIGADGTVQAANVLRSIPLLDQAALDAVRQWQYTPTLLNGMPVPVIMTVTVRFTLQ